jgi:hypothetical protein
VITLRENGSACFCPVQKLLPPHPLCQNLKRNTDRTIDLPHLEGKTRTRKLNEK